MKKIMALLIALVLMLPCIAIADENVKITVAILRDVDDHSTSFADKELVQQACATTGVDVEWVEIPAAYKDERLPVLLAGGDLPDLFLGILDTDTVSANSGLFMPLNDLVRENAPNLTKFFDKFDSRLWDMCIYPDGNMYALVNSVLFAPANDCQSLPLINTEWLKRVGMEKPTTLDEYVTVLRAFKEQDANGNGDPNDEIPFSISDQYWSSLFKYVTGNFGFTDYYAVRDGKVIGIAKDQAYREMLEFYHKLYAEGLMDSESFTQTGDQWKAKLQAGKVGVWYGWRPGVELAGSEVEKQYDAFMPPQAEAYSAYPSLNGMDGKFNGNQAGFAMAATCKNPEAALKWYDYFYKDEETSITSTEGKKGVTWDFFDGVAYELEVTPETDPNGYGRAYWKYTYGLGHGGAANEYRYMYGYESDPQARINMVASIRSKLPTAAESLPNRIVPAEAVELKNEIEADLLDYIKSFTANAVINGIDDASWEKHLSDMDAYRYDEWIEWQQKLYDGNF
mgnify:CR=1 FL=1